MPPTACGREPADGADAASSAAEDPIFAPLAADAGASTTPGSRCPAAGPGACTEYSARAKVGTGLPRCSKEACCASLVAPCSRYTAPLPIAASTLGAPTGAAAGAADLGGRTGAAALRAKTGADVLGAKIGIAALGAERGAPAVGANTGACAAGAKIGALALGAS